MNGELSIILQRVDSKLLSKLWLFYRDYFKNDDECLNFIFNAVKKEPTYKEVEEKFLKTGNDNYIDEEDRLFIPRRMLNCVERLVSAARDMEQIRQGKDIFKIIFLVTCVETLQKLCGKEGSKGKLFMEFFEEYTGESDKNYILSSFSVLENQQLTCDSPSLAVNEQLKHDSFKCFIGLLNEYRNGATHDGEYWEFCFYNDSDNGALILNEKIDLEKFSKNNKKEHFFSTSVSYCKFEDIFVRTCIKFIQKYVAKQEESSHANI